MKLFSGLMNTNYDKARLKMGYIEKTVEEFFDSIDNAGRQLQGFSNEVDEKRHQVETLLQEFEACSQKLQENTKNNTGGVGEAVRAAKQSFHVSIEALHDKISRKEKATEFMNKHEKYLVVMVFGAVKTGKSTLGNFLAGKNFLECDLDTPYKHREKPKFVIEESGRDSGEIVKDENGNSWFAEGVTDTTGSIQYFSMSGLRWFDSPGTGAIKMEQDKRNMEEMVKEYLDNTDLCVFLQNSSEPCLREDMKYIERLSRENQEALVVFTKSDMAKMRPVQGKMRRTFVAKDAETRRVQEDDACMRIQKMYPEMDTKKYRAISISTYLANVALQENDEEKFKASNIPMFMEILGAKAGTESLRLKKVRPKRQLNSFIDYALDGDGDFAGLRSLYSSMDDVIAQVDNYKGELEDIIKRLTMTVRSKVKGNIQQKAVQWSEDVERSGKEIQAVEIQKEILAVTQEILVNELEKSVGTIIEDYEHHYMNTLSQSSLHVGGIRKSYKEMEHKYTEVVVESRSASGFWENVCSFFGRSYYTTRNVEKVKKFTVDLGTNVDSFLEELLPQLTNLIQDAVRKEMENVRDNYFKPQEEYALHMKAELSKLERKLVALRYTT